MIDDDPTNHAVQQSDANRLPWQTPILATLAAGSAENGADGNSDDQINFS